MKARKSKKAEKMLRDEELAGYNKYNPASLKSRKYSLRKI